MAKNVRVTFLCPEELVREIDARGDRSEVLRHVLDSYFQELTKTRRRIEPVFTTEELRILAGVEDLEGTPDWSTIPPAKALLRDRLSEMEWEALKDAILRYHRAVATGMQVDVGGILR